ncbi:hypothetical protein HHK36_022354 [Tetracentron sinense]|uniref:DUF4220 domain-containing protein n=1 Tax=Tetracentron sinense TaxID=13715 RepID=A0A835D9I7_TETSI|nr:hypothetical protein HHK36_022354 [Tetracentron sinense]
MRPQTSFRRLKSLQPAGLELTLKAHFGGIKSKSTNANHYLIFMEERRAMEIFPNKMRKLWSEWELRTMVVISLFLQVVLIVMGKRRKYTARNRVRIILWLAYLSADWVATVSLGILSNKQGDSDEAHQHSPDPNDVLTAFWAPFLLLHLGGPDTITAYALEDNELWLRHLLGLIFQFFVALYVFIRSWTGSQMLFLSIPMFVAGMIKYGERTWVLRSASSEQFRDSMLTSPDSGPNYAKFVEEYTSKEAEGYIVKVDQVEDVPHAVGLSHILGRTDEVIFTLLSAQYFFETFKLLFADLILSFQETLNSQDYFKKSDCEKAFKVVEVELGFMYDALYTKATVVYTKTGCILRLVSFSSTVSAFVAFLIIDKHGFSNIDLIITHLLLVGAIVLEIYSALLLLFSEQAILYLSKHKNQKLFCIYEKLKRYRYKTPHPNGASTQDHNFEFLPKKMWSHSMAQYNLFSFCLKEKPTKFARLQKLFCIYEKLEQYRYKNLEGVSSELKELIFQLLKEQEKAEIDVRNQLCTSRGALILEKKRCHNDFREFIEAEFDQSILLWNIATDLCYYWDYPDTDPPPNCNLPRNCRIAKLVSEYMLYLLVMCPFMLPSGIGLIRFRDTCAEAMNFCKERKSIKDRKKACRTLNKVETKVLPSEVKGDRSKSVLFDACKLAKLLQSLGEDKWETMSHVWVEMLFYAASQCRGNYHAQQLRRGGELLTHVWLLMAHFGITKQIQISKGQVRAKLNTH